MFYAIPLSVIAIGTLSLLLLHLQRKNTPSADLEARKKQDIFTTVLVALGLILGAISLGINIYLSVSGH